MKPQTESRPKRAPSKPKAQKAKTPRKSLAERHASQVDHSAGLFGCWIWSGNDRPDGYGIMTVTRDRKSKTVTAHHIAWSLANAGQPVPRGKMILHTCNNSKCQNPAHLRIGTQVQNMADRKAAGNVGRRLTRDEILGIAAMGRKGSKPAEIAKFYGVNNTTARNILRGQTHSKITGIERNRATNKGRKLEAPSTDTPANVIVLAERAPLKVSIRGK